MAITADTCKHIMIATVAIASRNHAVDATSSAAAQQPLLQ